MDQSQIRRHSREVAPLDLQNVFTIDDLIQQLEVTRLEQQPQEQEQLIALMESNPDLVVQLDHRMQSLRQQFQHQKDKQEQLAEKHMAIQQDLQQNSKHSSSLDSLGSDLELEPAQERSMPCESTLGFRKEEAEDKVNQLLESMDNHIFNRQFDEALEEYGLLCQMQSSKNYSRVTDQDEFQRYIVQNMVHLVNALESEVRQDPIECDQSIIQRLLVLDQTALAMRLYLLMRRAKIVQYFQNLLQERRCLQEFQSRCKQVEYYYNEFLDNYKLTFEGTKADEVVAASLLSECLQELSAQLLNGLQSCLFERVSLQECIYYQRALLVCLGNLQTRGVSLCHALESIAISGINHTLLSSKARLQTKFYYYKDKLSRQLFLFEYFDNVLSLSPQASAPLQGITLEQASTPFPSNTISIDGDLLKDTKLFLRQSNLKAHFHIVVLWNYLLGMVEGVVNTYDSQLVPFLSNYYIREMVQMVEWTVGLVLQQWQSIHHSKVVADSQLVFVVIGDISASHILMGSLLCSLQNRSGISSDDQSIMSTLLNQLQTSLDSLIIVFLKRVSLNRMVLFLADHYKQLRKSDGQGISKTMHVIMANFRSIYHLLCTILSSSRVESVCAQLIDYFLYITEYYFYYAYHRHQKQFQFFMVGPAILQLDLQELTKIGPTHLIRLKDLSQIQFQQLQREIGYVVNTMQTLSQCKTNIELFLAKLIHVYGKETGLSDEKQQESRAHLKDILGGTPPQNQGSRQEKDGQDTYQEMVRRLIT